MLNFYTILTLPASYPELHAKNLGSQSAFGIVLASKCCATAGSDLDSLHYFLGPQWHPDPGLLRRTVSGSLVLPRIGPMLKSKACLATKRSHGTLGLRLQPLPWWYSRAMVSRAILIWVAIACTWSQDVIRSRCSWRSCEGVSVDVCGLCHLRVP